MYTGIVHTTVYNKYCSAQKIYTTHTVVHTYTTVHVLCTTTLHTHTHTYTPLTLTGLSKDNSRVLDPKNWTNDTTSAGTIMLVHILGCMIQEHLGWLKVKLLTR